MIRVLIIDDDKVSLAGLKATLPWKEYGMQVIGEATNGRDGLAFLEKHSVDLVMLDLAMPIMDGMTFIQKCRELYPEIQYVVMTFHEDFEYIQEALRLGVIDYISKLKLSEENQDELFARIASTVHKRICCPSDVSGTDNVQEIAELLQNPLWLCDDLCFWEMKNHLVEKNYHIQRLEIVLCESMVRLETSDNLSLPEIPYIKTVDDVIRHLASCRTYVTENAISCAYATMESRLIIAADFINRRYEQCINISQVADAAGFSRSYLSSCFNRYFGVTLNGFMRRKRIYESMMLIIAGEYSLTDIALKVGYESYQYFKKVFMEIRQETPKEFRSRYHAQQD